MLAADTSPCASCGWENWVGRSRCRECWAELVRYHERAIDREMLTCAVADRQRFTFAGLLGDHVQVDHGPTLAPDGETVWQVVIALSVPALDGSGEGKLTEVWTVPDDASDDDIAAGIIARTLAMLAHEAIEALRWRGKPVFDAHPSRPDVANEGPARSGANSTSEAGQLRPWDFATREVKS